MVLAKNSFDTEGNKCSACICDKTHILHMLSMAVIFCFTTEPNPRQVLSSRYILLMKTNKEIGFTVTNNDASITFNQPCQIIPELLVCSRSKMLRTMH